ncbi:MAG: type II/IV secretion system protein [Verrucomicrobia bacterium]|nr:type II/IV secretion system protein [Verrucomicrobiota bacterium]
MPLGKIQSLIVAKLVEAGRLTTEQRDALVQHPADLSGDALDRLLQEEYRVTVFQIFVARARAAGLAPFNVARYRVTPQTFERIPLEFCQEHLVVPVGQVGDILLVAFANPFEVTLPVKIQEMTGMRVVRLLGREKEIRDKFVKDNSQKSVGFEDVVKEIGAEYGLGGETGEVSEDVSEESGPIIQLSNRIIEDAYYAGTSDIHIEPQEKELVVRYRIDGVCQEKLRLPAKVGPALVARFKIMCNLDIAERRLPQDGRIVFKQYTKKGVDIDLRVSTAPLNHGEGVVMRILDKQKSTLPMTALGFSEENLAKYREVIRQPYGMILHCGPTGSGKSMTLYSALNEINSPELVIRTAEDPIEYTLAGINQMQMHRQIGLTFASALRAFLRQDPDIILVGEIRDKETANIAVEAALTGHLLISTLHTNDAPSTVARLTDMGIEPFMISSSMLCVCAQRLMRRVCKQCRQQTEPTAREKELLEKALGWSGPIYKANPKGCPKCGGSGYKGRVGIHELMVTTEELIEGINKGMETAELKKIAMRAGMKTLHQDSLLKVKEGFTTIEEAIANVPPDL